MKSIGNFLYFFIFFNKLWMVRRMEEHGFDIEELERSGVISPQEKKELISLIKNGVKCYPSEETLFLTLIIGRMPVNKALEWERDCNENFEGKRWVKAWHDHKYVNGDEKTKMILKLLDQLESRVNSLKLHVEEMDARIKAGPSKPVVRTLGAEGFSV